MVVVCWELSDLRKWKSFFGRIKTNSVGELYKTLVLTTILFLHLCGGGDGLARFRILEETLVSIVPQIVKYQ